MWNACKQVVIHNDWELAAIVALLRCSVIWCATIYLLLGVFQPFILKWFRLESHPLGLEFIAYLFRSDGWQDVKDFTEFIG